MSSVEKTPNSADQPASMSVRSRARKAVAELMAKLDAFTPETRKSALEELLAKMQSGEIVKPAENGSVNAHAHTFFSYCSEGYSPSRLVWEAVDKGLTLVGSTDFDVLDALEEMLEAGEALGIRTAVSLETRTFVQPYADKEINSPGEPGVLYSMGVGFTRRPEPDSRAGKFLAGMAAQSRKRNIAMVERINPLLAPVAVDYERDVLPLTPGGNATERHLCAAYDNKARETFPDNNDLAVFWADVMGRSPMDMEALLADRGAFQTAIRAKLMKKGGVGYTQPGADSFPPVTDFFAMVAECLAVPCLAWLDGGSAGEKDPERLLDDAMAWGARCVNVIPDRNWNIKDPEVKATKLARLDAFVKAARKRNLPILAGTELNSPGQKFVDSFDAPELKEYVGDFCDAAFWLYGHTLLERSCRKGAMSKWAKGAFSGDVVKSNAFYTDVGRNAVPGVATREKLSAIPADAGPGAILAALKTIG